MTSGSLAQLRALLVQLEGAVGSDDISKLCKEILKLGSKWPEETLPEEAKAFERLSQLLAKLADSQQQDIIAAFRPLREDVQRHMDDMTTALNTWLSEAPSADKAMPEKLEELLQTLDNAPQLRWYKQCANVRVKAHFLLAVAGVLRATAGSSAPLHSRSSGHSNSKVAALVQRLTDRFFVIPEHGNVLDTWHDGRLEYYNATLWRAAKRAADRLKDDLQVRLVSALRRAAAPTAGGKTKIQLQVALHQWPMVGCPLARTFLDFVAQRGAELGDLGPPTLGDCPPHVLLPGTLRKLLGRLDAFEVLDDNGAPGGTGHEKSGNEKVGIVRLRMQAVAALAFKTVGTKPKASSLAGAKTEGTVAGKGPGPASGGSPGGRREGDADVEIPGAPVIGPTQPVPARRVDWTNAKALKRLVRKGLKVGDEEWRQAWQQFCKQRRVPADAMGLVQNAPPREVLAEFVERNLPLLTTKEWSKDAEKEDLDGTRPVADPKAVKPKDGTTPTPAALAHVAAAAAAAARKRMQLLREEEGSSSGSESSRSKQQRRKRRKKRKLGVMNYGEYFSRGNQGDIHISPEVMMMNMNQMMGMSMMMNSPLAMMGMGAPMMTHQMSMMNSSGLKMKKEEKGEQPAGGVAAGGTAAAGVSKKAMIDADDL